MIRSAQPTILALFGAAASAATLVLATPSAGISYAHGYSTATGDAVGRPGLDNPAPLMRVIQALGDRVFNQGTELSKSLDASAFGVAFHEVFGAPNYEEPTHGANGTWKGVLNSNITIRDMYDRAQVSGLGGLPDEEDLPGTIVRFASGVPVTEGSHHDTPGSNKSASIVNASQTKLRKPSAGSETGTRTAESTGSAQRSHSTGGHRASRSR